MSWKAMSRGSYMTRGHIHDSTNSQYWPLLQNNPNILNAGVNIKNFSPEPFEEMMENNVWHKNKNRQS